MSRGSMRAKGTNHGNHECGFAAEFGIARRKMHKIMGSIFENDETINKFAYAVGRHPTIASANRGTI